MKYLHLQLPPSVPETYLPNPPPQNRIHLRRLLPQRPMRRINLLHREVRQMLTHRFAQVCREGLISESLDEEHWHGDAGVGEGEFFLVVYTARAVPIHCLFC